MTKKILILGAGRSSNHLIQHLATNAEILQIELTILDISLAQVPEILLHHRSLRFIQLSKDQTNPYEGYIEEADIVISMLPAFMHLDIAKICLIHKSHLITPSYISEGMALLSSEAKEKGLIFLNEMGFDPGIDHMTTMKIYHDIVQKGGKLYSYRSYAGGLVAARCDTNPWNYKFSWNPRNVILAGQGGEILFKKNGAIQSIAYKNLFDQFETIEIQNSLSFDAYANRDSLQYEEKYGWKDMNTLLRGTLRKQGFCTAWNFLIQLGLTNDTTTIALPPNATYSEFYAQFYQLPYSDQIEEEFKAKYASSLSEDLLKKLVFIGFFDHDSQLKLTKGSPAQILQSILEERWRLEEADTDWVVMAHFFEYELNGQRFEIESSMTLEGEDEHFTAMSKTVGMPIALACELLIQDRIEQRGVLMPISADIYEPILRRLEDMNIRFHEKTNPLV